jgi:hypothetical protein
MEVQLKGAENLLDPWYITGLVEGEGCFHVSFTLRKRLPLGIETRPSFSVSLNRGDLDLLKRLQSYFECGGIRFSRSDRTYKFEVRSVPDLVRKVLPHFESYPLQGKKGKDFERFSEICKKVHANLHRNRAALREIIEMAYSMNSSGTRKRQKRDLLRVLGEEKG